MYQIDKPALIKCLREKKLTQAEYERATKCVYNFDHKVGTTLRDLLKPTISCLLLFNTAPEGVRYWEKLNSKPQR